MSTGADDGRLAGVVDLIVQLATGDLKARGVPSPARDSVDAVIIGINLLADELAAVYEDLEGRVRERTEQLEQAHSELERIALYDPLTGLANRALLATRMSQALTPGEPRRRRTDPQAWGGARLPPALILLDLDEFKSVNDNLGHGAGDAVLQEVARRLRDSLGAVGTVGTVARLGGDEFAILVPDADDEDVIRLAERALVALAEPIALDGRLVSAGASVGVRLGEPGTTPEILMRDADIAMYAAKSAGRGSVQIFQARMHERLRYRLQTASDLGQAVAAGQLQLVYQPILDLATGVVVGAEALVRWEHPSRGLLQPDDFIGLAEETGLIARIGSWVLREALGQLSRWAGSLDGWPGFRLHVNVSPMEIGLPGYADRVIAELDVAGVQPHQVVLEIAETALISGEGSGVQALARLRGHGLSVGIDDFGTGYSSISYLRRLPIDTVKLDRSLINGLDTDPGQLPFLAAVVQLVKSAGLSVVAEGIESVHHWEALRELGCERGQGYALGRPMDAGEFLDVALADRERGADAVTFTP